MIFSPVFVLYSYNKTFKIEQLNFGIIQRYFSIWIKNYYHSANIIATNDWSKFHGILHAITLYFDHFRFLTLAHRRLFELIRAVVSILTIEINYQFSIIIMYIFDIRRNFAQHRNSSSHRADLSCNKKL